MSRAGAAAVALLAVVALPLGAAALEPRFDHRDTQGFVTDVRAMRDTVSIPGERTVNVWHPALRVGYTVDVAGEGNELILGAETALRSYSDPERNRVLLSGDARYRSYFGTEELKTFFDFGLWIPVRSRLGAGPLLGVGVQYDFSRWFGLFCGGGFSTAFGRARATSVSVAAGTQIRFPR